MSCARSFVLPTAYDQARRTRPRFATWELIAHGVERHSRSFALAMKLLPPQQRAAARVVYAWCRRADDAVDEASTPAQMRAAVCALRAELDDLYGGRRTPSTVVRAFGEVVERHRIPRGYADELIEGLAMDAAGTRYISMHDLERYCFRVAGTVGLMMCHVLGVRDAKALVHAAHLGMAMQLTNICRDVAEDWARGRLYVPRDLLSAWGAGDLTPCGPAPPPCAREPLRRSVMALLEAAERAYASADRGIIYLPWRAAFAVRTARLVYAAIGRALAQRDYDALRGRAHVPGPRKGCLVACAAAISLAELPERIRRPHRPVTLAGAMRFSRISSSHP